MRNRLVVCIGRFIDAPAVLRWSTIGITVAGLAGNVGNTSNRLNNPTDVAFDWANNLYIADYYNHRIQKYLFGTSNGITVAGNGKLGNSTSDLSYPSRILLGSNESLYITDTLNQRIQFWNNNASNATTIAGVTGAKDHFYPLTI